MTNKILKPRVNKALFYFRKCWDFEWAIWRLIDKEYGFIDDSYNNELPALLDKKLPPILKTLKLFPDVSGMISNGGIYYMFESYLGWKSLPSVQGLYEIGEYDTAQMLLYSYAVFKMTIYDEDELHEKIKKTILESNDFKSKLKSRTEKGFDDISLNEDKLEKLKEEIIEELYEEFYEEIKNAPSLKFSLLSSAEKILQITTFLEKNIADFKEMAKKFPLKEYDYDAYEEQFWDNNDKIMQNIVEHIRTNPNNYVTDEDGNPFDLTFTGIYTNPNDTINYELPMQDGKPHGHFKIYEENSDEINVEGEFEHGFLKSYTRIQ